MRIDPAVIERLPLDQGRFEQVRDKRLRPPPDHWGLKYLRGKAHNEQSMRDAYRGRAPYELLQNASDANATRAVFVITGDGLAFAHDGDWFSTGNFLSLVDGWSDKDAGQCIGHKGLGFRSVLDITPSPFLVRVAEGGFFGVKFSWQHNHQLIEQIIKVDSDARRDYEEARRLGRDVCPILAIPAVARKQQLGIGAEIYDDLVRGTYGDGYTTMMWLPAQDGAIAPDVLRSLGPSPLTSGESGRATLSRFLSDEAVVLLPFLHRLTRVEIFDGQELLGSVRIPEATSGDMRMIDVEVEIADTITIQTFWQLRRRLAIPERVRQDPTTPRVVRERLREAALILAARAEGGHLVADAQARFHVYFPTTQKTGLGVLVHGDFHVTPDRTRLMEKSPYNDWLLEEAAKLLSGRFLTEALARFEVRSVLESLAPTGTDEPPAKQLAGQFGRLLTARGEPYIPTASGLSSAKDVALAPSPDVAAFWDAQFTTMLPEVQPGKTAFLAPSADTGKVRALLRLGGLTPMSRQEALGFLESEAAKRMAARWWYDCYVYFAGDPELGKIGRDALRGRQLVPAAEAIRLVPRESDGITLTMPPPSADDDVPQCFADTFQVVDADLADLLRDGPADVLDWVKTRLHVIPFEPTEVLPRAVRNTAGKVFAGERALSLEQLLEAWTFLHKAQGARSIEAADFWAELGRFPVPLKYDGSSDTAEVQLAPAFLVYFPDAFAQQRSSLRDVPGLARLSERFLRELIANSELSEGAWTGFFYRVGVRSDPRPLHYARIVGAASEVEIEPTGLDQLLATPYKGERQHDENLAVARIVSDAEAWTDLLRDVPRCSMHPSSGRTLRSLTAIDALGACVEWAALEYATGDDGWRARLGALVNALPVEDAIGGDTAFCRGGRGGHELAFATQYIARQLDHYACFPTTLGPRSRSGCFARLAGQPFVSRGRSDDPVGDLLLPFVVADDYGALERLRRLGVDVLDDTVATTPTARLRALAELGERLASEWGKEQVLSNPGRWRLVRGAIQELYRRLNAAGSALPPSALNLQVAVRDRFEVTVQQLPVYYAEPGSPIDRAFRGEVPLLDADRRHPELFRALGIVELVSHGTVTERLLGAETSQPAESFREELVTQLARYILAPVVALDPSQADTFKKRLIDRLEIRVQDRLEVEFSLAVENITKVVPFENFYLSRKTIQGLGAIQEAHFTLYVAGKLDTALADVDGDALGVVLAEVLPPDVPAAVGPVFPRIVSRFQTVSGSDAAMRAYLHNQLNISEGAQDAARALLSGEELLPPPPPPPPAPQTSPPPLRVRTGAMDEAPAGVSGGMAPEYQIEFTAAASTLFQRVSGRGAASLSGTNTSVTGPSTVRSGPTPEQVQRGTRGEEEILARLSQAGGWDGFTLVADHRERGCGYDFLCERDGKTTKVELKTFLANGQAVLTARELGEAASSGTGYYLIGLLDDGGPSNQWRAEAIQNPWAELVAKGRFDLEATLSIRAGDMFDALVVSEQ